ncbi:4Fe-4S binding protein [Desulfovibrio sp. OH1186_COT-070]|uniref:4Fe-4S binding protein n=1 Tax=unclassified Desulfovibrio TaxID=2593640 RepID=UPI000F5DE46C|nr:ferredoxin [Desulfovibrio sp. OH1209_COT-279]RRD83294.1 ferredoxin [Desulfovibrio sp. OH1186_COT-070]
MAPIMIDPVACLKCPYCTECIDSCPPKALKCTIHGFSPYIYYDKCIECGSCIDACPTSAIKK